MIEAWNLGFNLGNTVKYISRAGKKGNAPLTQDLQKAAWYLNREIAYRQSPEVSENYVTNVEIRNFFRLDFPKTPLCNSLDFRGQYSLSQIRELRLDLFGGMPDDKLTILLLMLPKEVPETILRVSISSGGEGFIVDIVVKMIQ